MIAVSTSFVIHIHSGHGPTHYDLMLERGEALATWRLSESPTGLGPGDSLPAERLADHRAEYLTYEGPVSRGRGRVNRLDRGPFDLIEAGENRWEFELSGVQMHGRFVLERAEGGLWRFCRLTTR